LLFLKQIVSMSRNCVIAELTYLANREKKKPGMHPNFAVYLGNIAVFVSGTVLLE